MPKNAWFMNSIDHRREKIIRRLAQLRKIVAKISNQAGENAEGHRLLIAAYEDELATLDRHRDAHVAQAS